MMVGDGLYSLEYAIWCEAHHALLGVCSGLALLASYYLIWWITATYCQEGRRTFPCSWRAFCSLAGLSFGLGLVFHYLGDYGHLGVWWKW